MKNMKMKCFLHQSLIFLGALQSTGEEAWFPNQENRVEVCRNLSLPVCAVLGNNKPIFTNNKLKQLPFNCTAEEFKSISKADEGRLKMCIQPQPPESFPTVLNAERSDAKIRTTW